MFPLNLPNLLTVLRIMLVPALVVALLGNTPAGDILAAVVFAVASLTDFVDGYLARARGSVTTFGKLMDPLADKLLIVAALLALVSLGRLQAWVAMVIITRELAVTVLRLGATQAGVVMAASLSGKIKTCLQIVGHPGRDRRPGAARLGRAARLPGRARHGHIGPRLLLRPAPQHPARAAALAAAQLTAAGIPSSHSARVV